MSSSDPADGGAQAFQLMDNDTSDDSPKSRYYCGWEWHMRKEPRPRLLIYSLASRVVAKKIDKIFWGSAESVASHFGFNQSTAHRAMRALRKVGFFEWVGVTDKGTNRYRVLSHEDWQVKHPGQCATKSGFESTDHAHELRPEPRQTISGGANMLKAGPSANTEAGAQPVRHLVRELTNLSGGKVTFQGRHKPLLQDLQKEYTDKELISAFRKFIEDKDLEDPYILRFVAQNFLDAADALAYSDRKRKQEIEQEKMEREAAVARLQAEAKAEWLAEEEKQKEEAGLFDPLAD